jgi:hypothetical protein
MVTVPSEELGIWLVIASLVREFPCLSRPWVFGKVAEESKPWKEVAPDVLAKVGMGMEATWEENMEPTALGFVSENPTAG